MYSWLQLQLPQDANLSPDVLDGIEPVSELLRLIDGEHYDIVSIRIRMSSNNSNRFPFALPRIPPFVQEGQKFACAGISKLHVKGCPVSIFRVRGIQIPAAAG
jgi:hypothetical protein